MIVPENVQVEKKDLATDMIFVEGGTFEMGSPNEEDDGTIYNGSNNADEVALYLDNSGSKLHEVMTKKPNGLGIYDMSGILLGNTIR